MEPRVSGENRPASISAPRLALAVKRLRSETESIDLLASEPLAIVGVACRLPGVETPDDFWQILSDGRETISEMPLSRWKPSPMLTPQLRLGGYFDEVDMFDAEFFGIAPREAAYIDPQQRMMLETAWGALHDAGIVPEALSGTKTGIFAAIANGDYLRMQLRDVSRLGSYTGMGAAHCMASGRMAFLLDAHGPNMTVDTACSSSLVAAHLACQSLRSRESDVAIVAAANLKLLPDEVIVFAQWGMLASDARSKTFDARADGFVPGEGTGAIILKRLADALADGNRIRAVIRGCAVNHDGRTTVASAPNGLAQERVMRDALTNARVQPEEISYLETHGTGTSLGDPIEVEALRAVYDIAGAGECSLGAVKTNIGHLETAAGIAGMIKVVLALEHGSIPRNLHYTALNPRIQLEGSRFRLPVENVPWERRARPRLAGLSSFGMSGTNAHFILEEAPLQPATVAVASGRSQILCVSARSSRALKANAQRYADLLSSEPEKLESICASNAMHRSHLGHRLAITGTRGDEVIASLRKFVAGQSNEAISHGVCSISHPPELVFVFSGQGSTWAGMGRSLLEQERIARETLERIDALFVPLSGWSLQEALHSDDLQQRLQRTDVAQPLIFAIQVALAAVLSARGITPDAVAGHSVGEVAAAYVCGMLTLPDAVRVLHHRASAMQAAGPGNRMLAVGLNPSEVSGFISEHLDQLAIAAYNAPRSIVLAGSDGAIDTVRNELSQQGIFNRLLDVEFAFHTAQMEGSAASFLSAIGSVTSGKPLIPFISTVTGRPLEAGQSTAKYWAAGIRHPVRFQQAIEFLAAAGHTHFVEIGPRPVLANAITASAEAQGREVHGYAAMREGKSSDLTLAQLTAALYVRGIAIMWRELYPGRIPLADLPAYPWQRKRYWIEEADPESSAPQTEARSQPLEVSAVAQLDPASPDSSDDVQSVALHLREKLRAASKNERHKLLTEHLRTCARLVMGQDALYAIDDHQPLHTIGLDSLMAMTLRDRIQSTVGCELRAAFAFEFPSIDDMAKYLETSLAIPDDGKDAQAPDSKTDAIRR